MKFLVAYDKGNPDHVKVHELFQRYEENFAAVPGAGSLHLVLKSTGSGNNERLEIDAVLKSPDGRTLMDIMRYVYPKLGIQVNDLLELQSSLQGAGHARFTNELSLNLADSFGVKKINLIANLDVGGYAWVRKGFWPHQGREIFDEFVVHSSLPEETKRVWLEMDEAKLRKFVLTDAFRAYKPAFAGTSWKGFGDVTSRDFRDRYLGVKPEAQALSAKQAAMTANERYREAVLRYEVDLRRYSSQVRDTLDKFLEAENRLLSMELEKRLAALSAPDGTLPTYAVQRIKAMMGDFSAMREATLGEAYRTLNGELEELGEVAGKAEVSLLGQSLPFVYEFAVPPTAKLAAIIREEPFQGALMKTWFDRLKVRDQNRLRGVVKAGMGQGWTIPQYVAKIAGTKAGDYKDGVLNTTRREASAIARTAVNHVSVAARDTVWEENRDVIPCKLWLSTLDGRTTLLCIGRDHRGSPTQGGKLPPGVLPLDPPDARPPGHWQCRSTMIAYISGASLLGERPMVVDTRTRKAREVDFRAVAKAEGKTIQQVRKEWADKYVGNVPANTNYETFLKNQSRSFQDEVLGPTRADMWRSGKLTVDQFSDSSGRRYSLKELSAKYPQTGASKP